MPRSRRSLFVLLALVSAALLAAAWFAGSSLAAPDTMTLFVTGDTRGLLEPCGCRRDQAGGLAGRLAQIREEEAGDRVTVDCGNLVAGAAPSDRLKLRYLREAMDAMKYDAVNVGPSEVRLGLSALRETAGDLPLTSCGVVDAATGIPVFPAYRIVHAGGLRVAIIGAVDPSQCEPGPDLRVRPPLEALADAVPRAARESDFVIVLLWAPPDQARAVARRFREVWCVAEGDRLYAGAGAERVNQADVLAVADRGKVLGRITYRRYGSELRAGSSGVTRVRAEGAREPTIAAILARYRAELRRSSQSMAPEGDLAALGAGGAYAGVDACASCHAAACRAYARSKHAEALDALIRADRDFDPECLACHTTGYGSTGGFLSRERTPALAGVQCEACHGAASEHVASRGKRALRPATGGGCIRCHDRENSAAFDYAAYWPRIAHGAR